MIRHFSKCGNNFERIMHLRSEAARNCSLEELKAICTVMSFDPANMDKIHLLAAMIKELEERTLNEALELNCTFTDMDELEIKKTTPIKKSSFLDTWTKSAMALFGSEHERQ